MCYSARRLLMIRKVSMFKYLLVLSTAFFTFAAQAELTSNIGTATKYMFRGVKQSDQDIVVHGGVDYTSPWGVYAGAWAYTGSIEDFDTSEANAYAGVSFNLWNVAVGLGAITYERSEDKLDNTEFNLNLAWDAYRLSTYQDEDESYQYHEIAANYGFWGNSGLVFTVGLLDPEEESADDVYNYGISYVHALPGRVDFEVNVTRHDDKGNSLVLGLSRQFDW